MNIQLAIKSSKVSLYLITDVYLVIEPLLVVVLQQVRPVGGEELQKPVDGREGRVVGRDVVAVEKVEQNAKCLVQVDKVSDRLLGS